jgi:hypothetical protein
MIITVKNRKKLFACFVDFSKAFDTIPRDQLLDKVSRIGIGGKFLSILQSMYTNDKSTVKLGEDLSLHFTCHKGVKQGCMLSPTLFIIYLHDLPQTLNKPQSHLTDINSVPVNGLLYADDLVLISQTHEGLQYQLNKLDDFANQSKLTVNLVKTKIMVFNYNGRQLHKHKFAFNNQPLENVKEYKYLGLVFTCSGSFNSAKDELKKIALKALHRLKTDMGKFFRTDVDLTIKLFNTLIKPILLYGSEVWGAVSKPNMNVDPIEAVHVKFCKMLLGVGTKATNNACRAELGLFPIRTETTLRSIQAWTRYMNSVEKLKLSDHAILDSITNSIANKNNWAGKIKHTLDRLGLSFLIQQNTYINYNDKGESVNLTESGLKRLHSDIKQRLVDQEFQTWEEEICNDSKKQFSRNKLRTYRTFKTSYTRESYLKQISNINHRISLTKLRISDHRLHIETGRYTKPYTVVEDRICQLCKSGVEDEKHFLVSCNAYNNERTQLISEIEKLTRCQFNLLNKEDQFQLLINPPNAIQRQVAKFVSECLKKRSLVI